MKLHDLRPAAGSRRARTRAGRGIAAGKGKTAGRGTKGQKARTGGSIPAWFEGGQTPIHMRIPKLHGFRNRARVEYEVVNVGDIAQLVELGKLESGEMPGATPATSKGGGAPITVNQEILRAAGLVGTLKRPLKVLGGGDLSTALFVVADRFSKSAIGKIEAAGGTVTVLEVRPEKTPAIGVERKGRKAEAAGESDETEATDEAGDAPGAQAEPRRGGARAAAPAAAGESQKKPRRGSKPAGSEDETPAATGDE
jgi:large subunit ribosomal protein L15